MSGIEWTLIWIGWAVVFQLKANMENQQGFTGRATLYGIASSFSMVLAVVWGRAG